MVHDKTKQQCKKWPKTALDDVEEDGNDNDDDDGLFELLISSEWMVAFLFFRIIQQKNNDQHEMTEILDKDTNVIVMNISLKYWFFWWIFELKKLCATTSTYIKKVKQQLTKNKKIGFFKTLWTGTGNDDVDFFFSERKIEIRSNSDSEITECSEKKDFARIIIIFFLFNIR